MNTQNNIKTALPNLAFKDYSIRLFREDDAKACVAFYELNQSYLAPYENVIPEYFDEEYWRNKALQTQADFAQDSSCIFGIFDETKLIGFISFTNITRRWFQSCFLGYKIAEDYQGKGIMKGCLQTVINYMFAEFNLHRISANYIPGNTRSAKLLESLGFKQEGIAPKYLLINGKWQDHILTALINESWQSIKSTH